MDNIFQKFKSKFLDEAASLLDQMESVLLSIEKEGEQKELIDTAFRCMHTLKGVSSMYGFMHISNLTHQLENIFQAIREQQFKLTRHIIEINLQAVDHLRQLLKDEQLSNEENNKNHQHLLKSIFEISQQKENAEAPVIKPELKNQDKTKTGATYSILLRTDEKLYFRGINLLYIFSDLAKLGQYTITYVDFLSNNENDFWNIILYTTESVYEIYNVLMFIEDNCVVTSLTCKNMLESTFTKIVEYKPNEPSLLQYIEKVSNPESTHAKNETKNNISIDKNETITKRIAVDSQKLDHLMYLVSELITLNSQLTLSVKQNNKVQTDNYLEKLESLSKQFRTNVLEIRLVPLSDVILRFQRLIRDLSKQLGKKINLVTHGIDTELDKSNIDQLYEPLMHIIRNCIDHGIEMPEIRKSKGKPEEGKITITAYHTGNIITIKVEDDGCGIDHEKIRKKAIEKGLWPENYQPTEKETFDMIFHPGFSTAQSLTAISGRGIGMDIVRKKIQELRGDIEVRSKTEMGTTFIITLQQSIAILDSLLFTVGSHYFIVAISDILLCEQITITDLKKHRYTGTLSFNNTLIPFIDFREVFNIDGSYGTKIKTIIVKPGGNLMALLVDKIIGEHQAVLKPLNHVLKQQRFITAASELGDGNIAYMIDIQEILKSISIQKQLI